MNKNPIDSKQVMSQFEFFMEQMKREWDLRRETKSKAQAMREEIKKVSRKSDLKLISEMSKAERNELENSASRSRELLNEKLKELKSTSLATSLTNTKERAIQNAMDKRVKFFSTPSPPSPPAGSPEWIVSLIEWLVAHSVRHGQLVAPAYSCFGDPIDGQTCDPNVGLFKMAYHVSGQGGSWGWEAAAEAPYAFGGLVYLYIPQIDGILTVSANMHLIGTVLVHSSDHWWSTTEANLDFELTCQIQQGSNPPASCSTPVVKEKLTDSTDFYTYDEIRQAPCTAFVTADTPVFIAVGASIHGGAQSDYATVDVDFSSHNPEKYILVQSIDVSLDPAS